jgi:hypothetical protein
MSELLISENIPEKVDTPVAEPWIPTSLKRSPRFEIDWDMLNYTVAEKPYEMDWNKLIYGNEQMLEFLLNKEEERMPSVYYNYLFKKPKMRGDMEKHFLRERGIEIIDDESDDDETVLDKRLTIMYLEQTKEIKE